eukprot:30197_1
MHLYAQNGFNDIIFIGYNGDYSLNNGYMHCGNQYLNNCPISTVTNDGWKCDVNNNQFCDITPAPTTAIPTTNMPTTNIPTTNQPSTSNPTTNNPTTHNPTTNNPST